jgi:DNA (cytosine-5)-methyltransferase 1
MFRGKLKHWRSAKEIIDWNDLGHSIYSRKKPLAENTLRRIWKGIELYSGLPFMLGQQSGSSPRLTNMPVPTIAGAGAISIVQPFIIPFNTERTGQSPRTFPVDQSLQTVTTQGAGALIQPFIVTMDQTGGNGKSVRSTNETIPTINGKGMLGIVNPFIVEFNGTGGAYSVDVPVKTITGADRFGLAQPVRFRQDGKDYLLDIYFRMLSVPELARAMSFPEGYIFKGGRDKAVKQIGNSVPVQLAKALCLSILSN